MLKTEKSLSYDEIAEIGGIYKKAHDEGEITDSEYDIVADAFTKLYERLRRKS